MQNAGRNAHSFERAETADTEQQLLANANAAVAAIEARGQLAIFWRIPFDVGIEQEQVAAANFQTPDAGANAASSRFDLDGDGFAVGADRRLHRQMIHIGLNVFFLLPAVAIETLPEISLTVEQADADERNIQIGSALDVIACQDAQAA